MRALAVAWLAAGTLGCATSRKLEYTPVEFRAAVGRTLKVAADSVQVPFEVDAAAIEQAQRIAGPLLTPRDKARALAEAMISQKEFGIVYDPLATSSAREALRDRRGNCLGMSSLFIGLARGIGLNAYYLDASDRVTTLDDSDAFIVSSGHVSAVVRTTEGDRIVDFDRSISRYRTLRVMDDLQALAHYYNNRGYDLLREYGEPDDIPDDVWQRALAEFESAVQLNASLARAWNNAGIGYARLGQTDEAIVRYRIAISQDPDLAEAHNNLGVLYLRLDRPADALPQLRRAVELAPRNPYHLYHLALALRRTQDLPSSLDALRQALAIKPDYTEAATTLQAFQGPPRVPER